MAIRAKPSPGNDGSKVSMTYPDRIEQNAPAANAAHRPGWSLAAVVSVTFVLYVLNGINLATVPLFIAHDLALGTTAIGVASGVQFISAIAFRIHSGRFTDKRGPRTAVRLGLLGSFAGSLLCLSAVWLDKTPNLALVVLITGRVMLGGGESFGMTGLQTWALQIAGNAKAAMVIGWVGTAAFAAMAGGAPIGGILYDLAGFGPVCVFVTVAVLTLQVPLRLMADAHVRSAAPASSVWKTVKSIRLPLVAMSLAGVSYGAIITFSVPLFVERQWLPSWGALTTFSLALVAARLLLGSLPDRIGGRRAASLSLVILVLGLSLAAGAKWQFFGLVGTAIAGLGYAVVFPSLCREAVQSVTSDSRATALSLMSAGIYTAMGLGNPLLGVMADHLGTGWVFGMAAAAAVLSALVLVFTGAE